MFNRYKVQILCINWLIIRYSVSSEIDTEQLVCQKLSYLLSLHKRKFFDTQIDPCLVHDFEHEINTLGADPGFRNVRGRRNLF